jgi:hypothetical protein
VPKRKDSQNDPDLQPIADGADLGDWDVLPSQGPVRLATMISLRLDPDTAELVRRAARTAELTQSEFVRRAALSAAERMLRPMPVIEWARAHENTPVPQLYSGMPAPASTGSAHPVSVRELQPA